MDWPEFEQSWAQEASHWWFVARKQLALALLNRWVCPGPDGRFGWEDIYIPIKGDDRLEIVVHTDPSVAGELTVGIGSGANGVLDTMWGAAPSPGAYQLLTPYGWKVYAGGDYLCLTQSGMPAICPGVNEVEVDIYNGAAVLSGNRRLMSIKSDQSICGTSTFHDQSIY